MKLKMTEAQIEKVTVACLDSLHYDFKKELAALDVEATIFEAEEIAQLTRSIIAIEIIMKDLMYPDFYYNWKIENGVEL
tara:strand:+ start:87 stop:323 length:237 start_codon:yes stop_codon:yes gene_type:complete